MIANLLLPIAAGIGAIALLSKKNGTGISTGTGSATETGQPRIIIKKGDINRAFDSIKFSIELPSGQMQEYKVKLKKGDIQKQISGNYWLLVDVMEAIRRDGKPDPLGAVMIVVMNDKKQPITAKRIIMQDKNIIDVK